MWKLVLKTQQLFPHKKNKKAYKWPKVCMKTRALSCPIVYSRHWWTVVTFMVTAIVPLFVMLYERYLEEQTHVQLFVLKKDRSLGKGQNYDKNGYPIILQWNGRNFFENLRRRRSNINNNHAICYLHMLVIWYGALNNT